MSLIKQSRLDAGPVSWVKFGTLNAAFDEGDLGKSSGLIKGSATINIKREPLELLAGEPEMLQDVITIAESGEIKIKFAESDLAMIQRYIGGGTLTTTATNTADAARSITNEEICMDGTAYHKLNWQGVSSVVVTSQDATPQTFTVTDDYVIDATNGQIKRVSTGAITDGELVNVSYSASTPAFDKLTGGGNTERSYFAMRIIKKKRSSSPRYKVFDFYKVFTGEVTRTYEERAYNFIEVTFKAAADSTRTVGDQLYSERDEYAE